VLTTSHVHLVEHAELLPPRSGPDTVRRASRTTCKWLSDALTLVGPRHTCFMLRQASIRALLKSTRKCSRVRASYVSGAELRFSFRGSSSNKQMLSPFLRVVMLKPTRTRINCYIISKLRQYRLINNKGIISPNNKQ